MSACLRRHSLLMLQLTPLLRLVKLHCIVCCVGCVLYILPLHWTQTPCSSSKHYQSREWSGLRWTTPRCSRRGKAWKLCQGTDHESDACALAPGRATLEEPASGDRMTTPREGQSLRPKTEQICHSWNKCRCVPYCRYEHATIITWIEQLCCWEIVL